jgi:acetyl esterase/lipase
MSNKNFSFNVINDVSYKQINGKILFIDIYQPETKGPSPAAIVVHGGGWSSRTGDMENVCRKLARAGYTAFNVRYRLAPKNLYPAAVEDVRDAIHWVRDHADKYNINQNQMVGWGYSAGAHLILHVGLDSKINLRAIVAGGTPADLTAWPKSPIVTPFLGVKYADNKKLWSDASPVNRVEKNSPPVFLYHGKRDSLVEIEQMYKMAKALKEKNILVETYESKIWGHATMYLFGQEADKKAFEFIEQRTKN